MNDEDIVITIKTMEKTFPNPHLILKNLKEEDEFILLGSDKKQAYLSNFKLIKKDNGRYYPEYKPFKKDFDLNTGLLSFENFLADIYDPFKYSIIYDLIYFSSLYT